MVNGNKYSRMIGSKIIVFDLDGTITIENTFPIFYRFLIRRKILELKVLDLSKILFWTLRRYFKKITRAEFKMKLHSISINYYNRTEFIEGCLNTSNNTVLRIIEGYLDKPEYRLILNTAALPYGIELGKKIGFNEILTSSYKDGQWFENADKNKLASLATLLDSKDVVEEFYTDDIEDLPMIKIAEKVFLVNPSTLTLKEMEKQDLEYSIL
ncbi:MAG: hypothetical protein JXR03_11670 [Cyclobacteriaceae bacterium]